MLHKRHVYNLQVMMLGLQTCFAKDGKKAVDELLHHMYDSFKLDSINLYWGPTLTEHIIWE